MAIQQEVQFETTATPNFPSVNGRWAMVWMGSLVEVPDGAHAYQVPLYKWASEEEMQAKADELASTASDAHSSCEDVKVVISRGSGQWDGLVGLHVEGSR